MNSGMLFAKYVPKLRNRVRLMCFTFDENISEPYQIP